MAKSDMTCIYRGFAFIEGEILNGLISSGPNQSLHLGRKNIVLAFMEVALREVPLYLEMDKSLIYDVVPFL